MSEYTCNECGAPLTSDTRFCTACGAAAQNRPETGAVYLPRGEDAQEAGNRYYEPYQRPPMDTPTSYAAEEQPKAQAGRPMLAERDPALEPVSTAGFVGILFLMMIPVVNFILLIVWACGGCSKINKRNFARAQLIVGAICLAVTIGLLALIASIWVQVFGMDFFETIRMMEALP